MNLKQPWIVATTVAMAGFPTSIALACDDRGLIDHRQRPIVEMVNSQPDLCAESADSPDDAGFPSPPFEGSAKGAGNTG